MGIQGGKRGGDPAVRAERGDRAACFWRFGVARPEGRLARRLSPPRTFSVPEGKILVIRDCPHTAGPVRTRLGWGANRGQSWRWGAEVGRGRAAYSREEGDGARGCGQRRLTPFAASQSPWALRRRGACGAAS